MDQSLDSKREDTRPRAKSPREDNPAQSKCCLYVGNLSYKINDTFFKAQFEKFGDLEYARVVYEPGQRSQQTSRGYGFVKFFKDEDAIQAHKALNNKEFYGKEWVIQFSKRQGPRAVTPGRYLGHKKRQEYNSRRYQRRRSYSDERRDSRDRYRRRRDSRDRRSTERYRQRDRRDKDYDRDRQRYRQGDRDRYRDKDRDKERNYGRSKSRSRSRSERKDKDRLRRQEDKPGSRERDNRRRNSQEREKRRRSRSDSQRRR